MTLWKMGALENGSFSVILRIIWKKFHRSFEEVCDSLRNILRKYPLKISSQNELLPILLGKFW